MLEYRAEGLCRNANHLRREELYHCITTGEVLQSTALAFDTERRLRFELGGQRAYMPFEECVDVGPQEEIKDIAVLTRVGRPTCFVITGTEVDENGEEVFLLSRSLAQRLCRRQYLDTLEAGSVIPCTVTHIENFGAFCDIGCGIAALLPIDCLSVSRISSPADRVQVGQQLLCAIKNRDPQGRIVLTLRELLGTWSENAACFAAGETVVGIVRSVEEYGVFIEIAPNLAGLAEAPRRLESYDISHTAGQDMVASMVVFADGRPLKRDYRRFQVKTLDHADDLRAMEEVLERRFRRYLEGDEHFAPLPDLLLMDGGQLQAEAACHVLERLGLTVPVLGMVKDDRHRTRALVTAEGQELGIQQSPPLFALVGRVQEEVHRFAITYHHEKHTKSALTSRLDGIPGVGDVRKKALLKHFKSVKTIAQAELLQLEAVLPKAAARAVYDHFHKEETP